MSSCYQKLQVLTGDRFSTSQQQIPCIPILNAKHQNLKTMCQTQLINYKILFVESNWVILLDQRNFVKSQVSANELLIESVIP